MGWDGRTREGGAWGGRLIAAAASALFSQSENIPEVARLPGAEGCCLPPDVAGTASPSPPLVGGGTWLGPLLPLRLLLFFPPPLPFLLLHLLLLLGLLFIPRLRHFIPVPGEQRWVYVFI